MSDEPLNKRLRQAKLCFAARSDRYRDVCPQVSSLQVSQWMKFNEYRQFVNDMDYGASVDRGTGKY